LEKLAIAKGDLPEAIRLYKGYTKNDRRGKQQVEKVINLARKLKEA
jgi:hypothetical protein